MVYSVLGQCAVRVCLFIEVWAGNKSTLTRAAGSPGRGHYALRIALPRRSGGAPRNRAQPVAAHPPPLPPKLKKGVVRTWRLDLRSHVHKEALSKFIADVTIPRDVQHIHVHTSPRCTAFSRAQNFKQSKDLSTVANECLHGLKFARSVHGAVSKKRVRRGVTFSQSHEQSAGCSTTRALPHVSRSAWAGVGRGFPWAISPTTPRVTIRACAVKQPTTKRWTFETTSEQLYKVLKHHIKCPGCKGHKPVMSFKGQTKGYGTSASEVYTTYLGILVVACVEALFEAD